MPGTGTSVGDIFINLGLNLSELETSFIEADRTVAANISRLNREANLIRLRAEVEIAGLDETADAERILQIRQEALNRQMAIQRDRVRVLNAEMQNLVRTHGENSVVAQRAAVRLERERLALANLEREARNLNDTTGGSNSFFSELQGMLPTMPTKLQAVGLAFGAITTAVGAATAATKSLLDEFREVQKQSYELNMSVPDTREFLRELRLAGGDIGDFEGYIRGITDAWVKGEYDDPEFIALRKHGADIVDATGKLKNFKEITDEVYRAWKKADAAGEGIEFLQLTGGEAGVRDALPYFRNRDWAEEDAAKIFKVEVDDEQLRKLDRTMNLVTEQSGELQKSIGGIFTPAAQAASEKFFQTLRDATAFVEKNKDTIQGWGFVIAEAFDTISKKAGSFTDKLAEIAKSPKGTTGNVETDKIMSSMGWRYQEFNQKTPWQGNEPWKNFPNPESNHVLDDFYQRAEERQKAYNKELEETKKAGEKAAEGVDKTTGAVKENGEVLSQYGADRLKQFKDELEDLQIELDFGDNDYEKSLAQLDLWRKRELTDKNFVSSKERAAIEELYSAKLEQIEQERADRVAELNESITSLYQTELEKRLAQIEKEKQAWIDKCDDEVKATQLAEQQKVDAQRNAAMQVIKQQLEAYKAYEQGGFAGLRNYRLAELEKSGVDLKYLNMTPQQLMDFQRANQVAEKSLLPNFMTATDIAQYWQQMQQQMPNPANPQATSQPAQNYGVIYGDQVVSGLQNFGDALNQTSAQFNQTNSELANFSPMQEAAEAIWGAVDAQKAFADSVRDFPADYFRQLADGTKSVSEMQLALTDSTMTLIEAQGNLANVFANLPSEGGARNQSMQDTQPTNGIMRLNASAENLRESQDLLSRSALAADARLRDISDIPPQQRVQPQLPPQRQQVTQKDDGIKLGFDMDTFGSALGLGSLALMGVASAATAPVSVPVLAGIAALSGLAGVAKGSYDETMAAREHPNGELSPFGEVDLSEVNSALSALNEKMQSVQQAIESRGEINQSEMLTPETFAPLSNLDAPFSGIIQQLQDSQAYGNDALLENLGTLPNIEANVQSVLQELQARAEIDGATGTQMPDESTVDYLTPLTNIDTNVQNVLQELQTRFETGETSLNQMPAENAIDYLTPLMEINGSVQSILQTMQTQETTVSFETIVTPLNNIAELVRNVSAALESRQLPQITVSPNISVNLGGAYVFDNTMKRELVDDCTQQIVTNVTNAVRQATSTSNYSYGA